MMILRRLRSNPPLAVGLALVLIFCALALLGPAIAPKDPLARTLVAEVGGRLRGAPFPPFQSWEFPLGSDRFGRDLLSRLIAGIRPTLLLALIVGGLRLLAGVAIGMLAGWSERGLGRLLNPLIDTALALPVLVVALAAIAAVGVEQGLIAFIIGMALTGWAETAQIVRAQTRLVAAQPYIAAARALGANGPQVLIRHVTRHITPLMGMLLAFEVSATLLLTAALAFLGYFIGGGVWIVLDGDAIPLAQRVAGPPELGQLIGTAELRLSSRPPWEAIFPGLLLVLAILGFSLLGEGLRRRAISARPRPDTRLGALRSWIEQGLVERAGRLEGRPLGPLLGASLALALALGGGAWWWRQLATPAVAEVLSTSDSVAQASQSGWTAARGDPYGSLAGPSMPAAAPAQRWAFAGPAPLSGPAVGPDGTAYLNDNRGGLHALAPDGDLLWSAAIPEPPIGRPALGPDGTVYVVDRRGGLHAFGPGGAPRWSFSSSYRAEASSGPVVGPDGTIYYSVIDAVQAVGPDGQPRWLGRNADLPYQESLPRLSLDGSLVFLQNSAFSSADGSLQPIAIVPDEPVFAAGEFVNGADGRSYYRSEHRLIPWRPVAGGLAIQPPLTWAATNTFALPADVGVSADGTAWMLYAPNFGDTRMAWISQDGTLRGEVFFPLTATRAVAAAPDGAVLLCGLPQRGGLTCGLYGPESDLPRWEVSAAELRSPPSGGALVDGTIYVAAGDQLVVFGAPAPQ